MKYDFLILILPLALLITIIVANIVFATATPVKNFTYYRDGESGYAGLTFSDDNTVIVKDAWMEEYTYTVEDDTVRVLGSDMKKSGYSLIAKNSQTGKTAVVYTCHAAITFQVLFAIGEIALTAFIIVVLIINRNGLKELFFKTSAKTKRLEAEVETLKQKISNLEKDDH